MHENVADLMLEIEAEMRRLDLWGVEVPSPERLASAEPFCIDTLSLPEWIQFVFIVRLKVIVEEGRALPSVSGIAPIVEEYFRGLPIDGVRLIALMEEFDQLVSI